MTLPRPPKEPTFVYNAKVINVIDGDTATFTVSVGFHISVEITARFYGINAPEVSTVEGKTARAALRKKLMPGADVVIKTFKDPGDKYGRWLAVVALGDESINQWLLNEKLAVPYNP